MEQAIGDLLAAELAPKPLGVFFRVRHCGNDLQVTDRAVVSGGSQNRGETETDAVGGSTLEGTGETSWNTAAMDTTSI